MQKKEILTCALQVVNDEKLRDNTNPSVENMQYSKVAGAFVAPGSGRPFSFFFSSRRRHTRFSRDWSSDVCSSDLADQSNEGVRAVGCVFTSGSDPEYFVHVTRFCADR